MGVSERNILAAILAGIGKCGRQRHFEAVGKEESRVDATGILSSFYILAQWLGKAI